MLAAQIYLGRVQDTKKRPTIIVYGRVPIPNLPEGGRSTGSCRIVVPVFSVSGLLLDADQQKTALHILIKPISNDFRRPNASELNALTAPARLATENGIGSPPDFSLAREADGSYVYQNETVSHDPQLVLFS